MQYLFLVLGVLGIGAAAAVAFVVRSDIQLILAAVCAFGGATLVGIGYLIAVSKN